METLIRDTRDALEGFANIRTERMQDDSPLGNSPCFEAHRAKSNEIYKMLKRSVPADLLPMLVEYSNIQSDMEADIGNVSYCQGFLEGLMMCQLFIVRC